MIMWPGCMVKRRRTKWAKWTSSEFKNTAWKVKNSSCNAPIFGGSYETFENKQLIWLSKSQSEVMEHSVSYSD